jgi:hypothetical protein
MKARDLIRALSMLPPDENVLVVADVGDFAALVEVTDVKRIESSFGGFVLLDTEEL